MLNCMKMVKLVVKYFHSVLGIEHQGNQSNHKYRIKIQILIRVKLFVKKIFSTPNKLKINWDLMAAFKTRTRS